MGSLVAELAEKLSAATNSLDFDEQTMFLNTSANTVGIGTNAPASKLDVRGTMQVGVDGTGHDVKFFGDTASAYMLWDESADDLVLAGVAGINVSGTGTITGTLATVAQANITSLGTLTALTVDDVAINGKVLTMTGSASDTAVFTVATNGALSIVTTDAAAAAANLQITADGTVDIDSAGVLTLDSGAAINIEPASGSAILLDGTISIDAGVVTGATSITSNAYVVANDGTIGSAGDANSITINSAGVVTMDQIPVFSAGINVSGGTIAGTLATAAQANITSLGTLTTLTVDNVITNGTTIGHTSDTDLLTLASAALTLKGTLTTGVDDTGHDVKFFGATAGKSLLWDESADELIVTGRISVKKGSAFHSPLTMSLALGY